MAETIEGSNDKVEQCELSKEDFVIGIKKELDILVKPEPHECIVCVARSFDTFDIYCTTTSGSGFTVQSFLSKYTTSSLGDGQMNPKHICKNCLDLVNVLEQTEIEYIKLKEAFDSIISKNPLFELQSNTNIQPIRLESVKNEMVHIGNNSLDILENLGTDSEDEPLSMTKKKRRRKPEKRKKKTTATGKRKVKSKIEVDDSWECNMCGMQGESGGEVAETAHKMAIHGIGQEDIDNSLSDVKKEENSDGSQTFNNGFEDLPKFEIDFDDDDDNSSNYIPEEEIVKTKKRLGRPPKSKKSLLQKNKKEKVLHKCDQCDAKYSSLLRLQAHMQKHEASKPPYICEVCGAHYKHKRACDIHIALHKGISDWKCEECNKLFPSKGALARHNNIHTGKLNYQCDLCGKSFIHTSSFKMHKLSHSGVKPHACDVCGLALMTRSHLKRHKRVHSGEKRHECGVCGKRFSERYNLAAHAKSHEAGGVVVPAPRQRLFRCAFCPERFERRYMLERHMSTEHGRALERPPPTPRNTMSKLLKAQARRHAETDTKEEVRSESRSTPVATQKLIAQLSAAAGPGATSAWSSAYTEFNLRADFPH